MEFTIETKQIMSATEIHCFQLERAVTFGISIVQMESHFQCYPVFHKLQFVI